MRTSTNEQRVDQTDGQAYPRSSFHEVYGEEEGDKRWAKATTRRPGSPEHRATLPKIPTPASDSGVGHTPGANGGKSRSRFSPKGYATLDEKGGALPGIAAPPLEIGSVENTPRPLPHICWVPVCALWLVGTTVLLVSIAILGMKSM